MDIVLHFGFFCRFHLKQLVLIKYIKPQCLSFSPTFPPNAAFSSFRCGPFPVHWEPPLATWPVSSLHLCGYTGIGSSLHTKADNGHKEEEKALFCSCTDSIKTVQRLPCGSKLSKRLQSIIGPCTSFHSMVCVLRQHDDTSAMCPKLCYP
ncbi:UNVERIFIED_CONTAM: hypothetical protein K2H54_044176 [Gekko kuhli]